VVAYTIGMVPPTKTQEDDGKVIDATGRFGGFESASRPGPADEPEVYAPRQLAAQLMVPADPSLKQTREEPRDDYFAALLEDQRRPDASVGAPARTSTTSKHRELDQFFEDAIEAPLRSTPAQPRAAGSASLDPRAISNDRSRRHVNLRWITAAGTAALAVTGLLVATPVGSPHHRPGQSPGMAGAPTRVSFLDPIVHNTENAARGITEVTLRREPQRTGRHRHAQRHRPRHAAPSAPDDSTFVARATAVPVSSTSTVSHQSSTAPTESSSTHATTVATAGTTNTTQPRASSAKRPAFGQTGVLGPGHSPDS
jgi:hypothetical protein